MIRNIFMMDRNRFEACILRGSDDFAKILNLMGHQTAQMTDFIGITESDNSVTIIKCRYPVEGDSQTSMSEEDFEIFADKYLS